MTNSEKEVLLIAQEECAEVTQAISKVFRFGFDSVYNNRTNKQRLEEEIGDLLCMIELMVEKGIINQSNLNQASFAKKLKLQKWSNIFEDERIIN